MFIVVFIFRTALIPFDTLPNDMDKQTSNMMVDLWANFATYGKPVPSLDQMLDGGKKKLGSLVSTFLVSKERFQYNIFSFNN